MQSANLYAYVMNNPIRWIDPTGLVVAQAQSVPVPLSVPDYKHMAEMLWLLNAFTPNVGDHVFSPGYFMQLVCALKWGRLLSAPGIPGAKDLLARQSASTSSNNFVILNYILGRNNAAWNFRANYANFRDWRGSFAARTCFTIYIDVEFQ